MVPSESPRLPLTDWSSSCQAATSDILLGLSTQTNEDEKYALPDEGIIELHESTCFRAEFGHAAFSTRAEDDLVAEADDDAGATERELRLTMAHGNTSCTTTSDGNAHGLVLTAFTVVFDKHFGIDSAKIDILLGEEKTSPSMLKRSLTRQATYLNQTPDSLLPSLKTASCGSGTQAAYSRANNVRVEELGSTMATPRKFFQGAKQLPRQWGLSVRFIRKLFDYVVEDFTNYAQAHRRHTEDFTDVHVCLAPNCRWHHSQHHHSLYMDEVTDQTHLFEQCIELVPNMHLLVERYVKPWTSFMDGAGLALLFNAGSTSVHRQVSEKGRCEATVFISHCWAERFELFVRTLNHTLDPDTVVWVCSFAICQHSDIASQLCSLEECPFAIALRVCSRVLVITDSSVEALTRCWCVLEAELARKWCKTYDICLPDDGDSQLWEAVSTKIQKLDIAQCNASQQSDKEAILKYAEDNVSDGVEGLNQRVREIAKLAEERAQLMSAAACGDLKALNDRDITELTGWRSVRGRTLTHIAAARNQVAVVSSVLVRIGMVDIDVHDLEGNSPLSVAASEGAVAGVQALLGLGAHVNGNLDGKTWHGMSPLACASAKGHASIAVLLMDAQADVEWPSQYLHVYGRRPLHIAAREGFTDVIRVLAKRRADVDAQADNGMTVLFHAISGSHSEALGCLVALRANVNQSNGDSFRRTPLMGTIGGNRPVMIGILLEANADITARDGKKKACLDYVSGAGTLESRRTSELVKNGLAVHQKKSRIVRCRVKLSACITM